jgi:hypothetical protein
MLRARVALRLAVIVLPMLLPAAAHADDDPALDLAFWQSIQSSTDPAEYQAYLDTFPNGKFAKLALLRAHPTASAAADEPSAGKIVLLPAAPRVGQTIRITCENFPEPTNADEIIVVPAGTPVMDPSRPVDQTKVLYFAYALNCYHLPLTAGPFAPGAYEVRFMTRLYSNAGVSELRGTAGFWVR